MGSSRKLLIAVAFLAATALPLAPARAQGMETVLQVLLEVLAASTTQSDQGDIARQELEAELDAIHYERRRIAETYEQRRWEVEQRASRRIERVENRGWRKRERRHRIREIARWRDEELYRLSQEEAHEMAELDRRERRAERRYRHASYESY